MDTNESKNFWDSKPYWCQPWSIVSFGLFVITLSWIIFNNLIFTSIVSFFIIIWWIVFLILVPKSYQLSNK